MPYTAEQMRRYMRGYRAARMADATERLGGKCVRCGSAEDLEFDHIDPSTKVKPLTSMLHASKKLFEAELAKCQLLCSTCHDDKSVAERGQMRGMHHGTTTGYRRGCRCRECSKANTEQVKAWRLQHRPV